MEKYVREEQFRGYVCKWTDSNGFNNVIVDTLEDAYALYMSKAKYVDGSDFTCTTEVTIRFK